MSNGNERAPIVAATWRSGCETHEKNKKQNKQAVSRLEARREQPCRYVETRSKTYFMTWGRFPAFAIDGKWRAVKNIQKKKKKGKSA